MNELGKNSGHAVAAGQVSMIQIDEECAGQRIDNFLIRICKGVPKSHVYRILRSGEVRVNKGRVGADYRLEVGDLVRVPPVRVAAPELEAPAWMPAPSYSIVHEDDYVLVIDKPAGLAVHGGSGVSFGVIEQLRNARPKAKFLELVHRLDRETSGLLMIAKRRSALVALHEQIRENRIDKRYLACVVGDWHDARRAVKAPLHKYLTPEGERRVRVQDDGLASHTIFNLIERFENYAVLECELKTGRTHQIRVHLQHLGTPIVGDEKYGDFALNRRLSRSGVRPGIKRMFLHAYKLRFTHPGSGESVELQAPLPADCRQFIDQLREDEGNVAKTI
ncbi:RluA family pseudouridine synthase [Pararobbsia alpina]|uniref:Pseudouridine synthase n=1 Tax=Pararobbsia alpina TaxID=621374 RepID=A0A6S7B3Z5_9BURK|nr:RluA family pseudouridine synthase [Pararobbsia alpina]CAB3786966.1 Ribosomal large subunit pseudouridine synthase C [Pararobbsia alpina]